jgi:signal transduction histidine kinase
MKKVLIFVLSLLGYDAFSQLPFVLGLDDKKIKVTIQFHYFEDFSKKFSANDIGKVQFESNFKATKKTSFGYTSSAIWLKINLKNTSENHYLLELDNPNIDKIEFFLLQNNQIISHFIAGDHQSIKTYPIKDRTPIFPLNLVKNQTYSIYLSGNSTEDLSFKLTFWEANSLYEHLSNRNLLWGIFFGFILVISFYNFFLWLTIRDKIYFFYIIYVLSFGLFQFSLYGFGFQYLWDNSIFNEKAHVTFLGISVTFLTIFSIFFLELFKILPKSRQFLSIIGIIWVFVYLYMVLTFNHQTYKILIGISIFGVIFQYYFSIKLLLQGNKSVLYYLLATIAFTVAILIIVLKNFVNFFPGDFYLKLGSMIEMVLFSVALGDKYRYIKLEQLRQQKIRNDIASNLHDDLAASLSSLTMFSEMNRMKVQKTDTQQKEIFENISRRSREMMKQVREAVWEINPKNDQSDEWLERMIKYARETLDSKKIDLHLNIGQDIEKHKLHIDDRRNVYLFFKEAINNTAKYSEATLVEVDCFIKNGKFHLSIKDNGKGFEINEVKKGNGILNFKMRAAELKGLVEIVSEKDKGTQVSLSFP